MNDAPAERGAASWWDALRRRKVVQWTVAYAAGAWVLLQVLDYAADAFAWPPVTKPLAMLGAALGLPVVATLAWFHGERSRQRVTGRELAVLTVLLLVGGGLLWWYADRRAEAPAATVANTPAPAVNADARPSIAVLPFDNRSRLEDDAYFVDGIHDDVLTQLSKVSALRVISRTSVEQFRDTKLPMKAIADQLGVTKILEGGVQRAGDRVRVTVQLIDVATDAHLWAENYDRELSAANIFAIQSEVAAAIADALKAALTPGEQARIDAIPTRSLEAWQAYQLGKQQLAKRTSAALTEGEGHFRRAIALDAKFALAWVGLADALGVQASYGYRSEDAVLAEAEQAIAKALELNSSLAEAWASAGLIAWDRQQSARAEQMLRRAITLNPNLAPAHHWLSRALTDLGRRDEALAAAERAVVLDPLSAIINISLGQARSSVGRFNDALLAFKQAIEIDPVLPLSYRNIGEVYAYGFGRFDIAMPWYEKSVSLDPDDPYAAALVALTHWELGNDAEAERRLDRLEATRLETAFANFAAALLYLDRGDKTSAHRHAQRAAEEDPVFTFLVRDGTRRGGYADARARYSKGFPILFATGLRTLTDREAFAAVDLALVLQHTGEGQRATVLMDRAEADLRKMPRMGPGGYWLYDVAIHALRGDTAMALKKLREAEQAGWRAWWRYYRDFDPNLASIRNEPEFKAVFADIERDMARQRAALADRPKDAPLEIAETGT